MFYRKFSSIRFLFIQVGYVMKFLVNIEIVCCHKIMFKYSPQVKCFWYWTKRHGMSAYVMLCAIWYYLYNFKNVKNTHGGVLLFGCFSGVFFCRLYKWYRIAQSVSYYLILTNLIFKWSSFYILIKLDFGGFFWIIVSFWWLS